MRALLDGFWFTSYSSVQKVFPEIISLSFTFLIKSAIYRQMQLPHLTPTEPHHNLIFSHPNRVFSLKNVNLKYTGVTISKIKCLTVDFATARFYFLTMQMLYINQCALRTQTFSPFASAPLSLSSTLS